MAGSDAPRLVTLQAGDEKEAISLSIETGWNQVEEDWRHFIVNGKTIGFRDNSGALIATAAALPYSGPFGFIGMVIVTGVWRRKGLATNLVERCIAMLREDGRIPVLDATEQGEPVYSLQGFVPQFRFDRWEIAGETDKAPELQTARPEIEHVAQLDEVAFGAGRTSLIGDFLGRSDTIAISGDKTAFGMLRRGRRAWQAGPVVALDEEQAVDLLERLIAPGIAIFIDIPQRWGQIGNWLRDRKFSIQRSFARMALGRKEPFGEPARLFAVAGPEFG